MSKLVVNSRIEFELVPTSRESLASVLPYASRIVDSLLRNMGHDPSECPACQEEAKEVEKDLQSSPAPATV